MPPAILNIPWLFSKAYAYVPSSINNALRSLPVTLIVASLLAAFNESSVRDF